MVMWVLRRNDPPQGNTGTEESSQSGGRTSISSAAPYDASTQSQGICHQPGVLRHSDRSTDSALPDDMSVYMYPDTRGPVSPTSVNSGLHLLPMYSDDAIAYGNIKRVTPSFVDIVADDEAQSVNVYENIADDGIPSSGGAAAPPVPMRESRRQNSKRQPTYINHDQLICESGVSFGSGQASGYWCQDQSGRASDSYMDMRDCKRSHSAEFVV